MQEVATCSTSSSSCCTSVPMPNSDFSSKFPLPLATALFSFLYHLASYEAGGEALVSCGMMESLLQVINWHGVELEHITVSTINHQLFKPLVCYVLRIIIFVLVCNPCCESY